jgi:hypothetical protein
MALASFDLPASTAQYARKQAGRLRGVIRRMQGDTRFWKCRSALAEAAPSATAARLMMSVCNQRSKDMGDSKCMFRR